MTEHRVSRLISAGGWLLYADGTFRNPRADGATSGNVDDPAGTRQVFNYQNTTLNPHFAGVQAATAEDGGEFTFALERDLQKALRENIEQLEPGLRIVDGGSEQAVDAGRIDITAEARDGALVVIELKAGACRPERDRSGSLVHGHRQRGSGTRTRHPGRGRLRQAESSVRV